MSQTKAEKAHVQRVVRLGCICCRLNGHDTADVPCEVHHIRSGITGAALRATWWRVLGLCAIHHRQGDGTATFDGQIGYHVSPEEWTQYFGEQEDLLAITLRELGLNPNDARFLARPLAEPLGEELAA